MRGEPFAKEMLCARAPKNKCLSQHNKQQAAHTKCWNSARTALLISIAVDLIAAVFAL